MSRSYRKNAFDTYVCYSRRSMKAWRTQENRRLRHNAKQLINNCLDYDALIVPVLDDYDTLWGSPQDGKKHYIPKPALNQCEIDLEKRLRYAFKWYADLDTERMVERYKEIVASYEHNGNLCNCYTNKKSSYWVCRRK